MSKNHIKIDSVFSMPIAELEERVAKARAALAQVAELFPGLVSLTEDDRRHSDGKLRTGEADALGAVLDVTASSPHYFVALADKDGGVDPKTFETDFLRDHLARRALLADVTAAAEAILVAINDTVLTLGSQVRPVVLAAYQIAKPVAAVDEKVRTQLAPAIDFFGRIARRGAETRARKAPEAAK